MIPPDILAGFAAVAEQHLSTETCALVILQDGSLVLDLVPNTHHDPTSFFRIARRDTEGKDVQFVLHSHPKSSEAPSLPDRGMCREMKVPWAIYSLVTRKWFYMEPPEKMTPLLGRPFCYGVFDCQTLLRDYYLSELGIVYECEDIAYGFWNRGEEPYMQLFDRHGFHLVKDRKIRAHDVILMQYASNTTNHAGIITKDGYLLHHTERNVSCQVPYGGYWMEHTTAIVRHYTQC